MTAGSGSAAQTTQGSGGQRSGTPLRAFIATQNASAVVLLAATVAALVWANSPWAASYEGLWGTVLSLRFGAAELALDLRLWINDGLMALFFFVVGLEIRREFDMGELRERRRVALPVLAAVGGMAVPALIYVAFNAGEPTVRGWGIPMGTDTAFALGVLTLVAGRWAVQTRTYLLTLVIVDDVIALSVVALAYTSGVSVLALSVAVALFGVVLGLRRAGVHHGIPYFLVGSGIWLSTLASGVHPTIAGIAMGLLVTAYAPSREALQRAGAFWRLFREEPTPEYAHTASRGVALAISPNERLQHLFHPWTSFVIVPLFALANAGVALDAGLLDRAAASPVTLGILFGLVVGKPAGVMFANWLFTRRTLGGLPLAAPWPPLFATAAVTGIGFTVAMLVAIISLRGDALEDAKIGIMAGSIVASLLSWLAFRVVDRLPPRLLAVGQSRLAAALTDLAEPIDPELDHVRGPATAPVTLVEYGDFECPHCGQAEPVVRELLQTFGADLRFVFRHLPLQDVHEHAELAAEAAEAAAAQGMFWQMHDLLFANQAALRVDDLRSYGASLALDVDRFMDDTLARRYAGRVARDLDSADGSNVAGTPTFFINGRRHYGAYDVSALTASLLHELSRVRAADSGAP